VDDGRGNSRSTQGTDIAALIDHLEELVATAKRVPLSNRVMVEEEELLAIVDQLRLSVPQEMKQARRVVQERQKILTEAQVEADKILGVAKERAEYLMNDHGLVNEAKVRSEEILRQAQDKAKRSMGEIDVYALHMLTQLEHVLQENLQQIQQAKEVLSR
jgi:F0F1-type ATP synthase membrane subunit b/b'